MGPRSNNSPRSRPDTVRGADKEDEPMKPHTLVWRFAATTLCASVAVLTGAGAAYAQAEPAKKPAASAPKAPAVTESQTQARAILMRMAEFLAGTQSFSVSVRGDYDAVQTSGQKIEFGEIRTVTLSRPDRLRVEGQRSDGVKTLTVFTGKEIVLIDARSEEHTSELQSQSNLVCRLLLEKK